MNKAEKEVFQYQLDKEKEVLKRLESHYKSALNDVINKAKVLQADIDMLQAAGESDDKTLSMARSKVYQLQYQKTLQKQIEGILEKLHSDEYSTLQKFLNGAYEDGYLGTMYSINQQGIPIITPIDQAAMVKAITLDSKIKGDLYEALGVDTDDLKKTIQAEISRGISTSLSYADMARNISNASKAPLSRAKTIARTESHRIQQASADDARRVSKSKGADVVKQWDSTMDGSTRPTHRELDGQIKEVDEPFKIGSKKAMYPGDFGDPAEDCNCRCAATTRARWALDEAELETLKQRAEFFGLDKTEDFADYKKKYLKASDTVNKSEKSAENSVKTIEKTGKSGKIKVNKTVSGHSPTPKEAEPNSVIDHVSDNGIVDTRAFYGNNGLKEKDIHTTDHGNPKWHNYGKHGEHAHDYEWNEDGSLKTKSMRELTDDERERNGDIL